MAARERGRERERERDRLRGNQSDMDEPSFLPSLVGWLVRSFWGAHAMIDLIVIRLDTPPPPPPPILSAS